MNQTQLFTWLIVALIILFFSGIIWFITKFISKIGSVLIPVLTGLLAALFVSKNTSDIEIILIGGLLTLLGILATLCCMLYAEMFDTKRRIDKLEKRLNLANNDSATSGT